MSPELIKFRHIPVLPYFAKYIELSQVFLSDYLIQDL